MDVRASRARLHQQADAARARVTREQSTVTLVTGPPCSGKTTYVREHMKPGDMVIDYDALAVALGSPSTHDHPDALRPFVLEARDAAVARVSRTPGTTAWLIKGQPTVDERAMASRVVMLDVPADECKRRAEADGRPARWAGLIDAWWASHTAD